METGYLLKNEQLQRDWGHKYIDMISPVLDANNEVPVFTPNCMFISQDCRHFTKAGAQYYAALLSTFLEELFSTTSSF